MNDLSQNFDLFNLYSNKNISVVVQIDGVPGYFANRAIYTTVNYGDPGIFYGMPGLVYGQLKKRDDVRDILSLEASSLNISQRLEPEQGRGAVSTISLAFIDKDEYMTQVTSPGVIVDEILGKEITLYLGYQQISFPGDYLVVFRGFINNIQNVAGLVVFQISDPNIKRRQTLFFSAKTTLSAGISNAATTIPVVSAGDFHQQVLGPNGTYDSAIKTYIKIEDEFIEYPATGISGNSFVTVTRGARTTAAVAHASGTDVTAWVQIQDHAIDMALKLMLSGWAGNWGSGFTIIGIVNTGTSLANVPNGISFPLDVDVIRDYGLSTGDQVTISGATNGGNNVTRNIIDILDADGQPNRVIVVDGASLISENPTGATVAFRSQYDTYPSTCGLKLKPRDVDVAQHLYIKDTFLGDNENSYSFLISESSSGKDFLESEIYLPVSCYSLTRRGRCSVQITKAPLASADLVFLKDTNVLSPENIKYERGLTSRKFFNEIVIEFDMDDAGVFAQQLRFIDSESLSLIGISSVLPISSAGAKSFFSTDMTSLLTGRANLLLSRYKRGAVQISLTVNWMVGVQIEAGDVVALNGDGLFIANTDIGSRDFGVQLLEVTDRGMNIRDGTVSLKLVAGVGALVTDRFGTISPSSFLTTGSTTTKIHITESFSSANPVFPSNEPKKWRNYIGMGIAVHSEDFSFYEEVVFTGFDPTDAHYMNVSPALSVPPPAGYVVDIIRYPTSTNPMDSVTYKAIHAFLSPQVLVATGISSSQFTVSGGDISKFFVGGTVRVHNYTYSIDSTDVTILDITGTTITTDNLGFTPTTGQYIDLIGFADEGSAYRFV